MPDEQLTSDEWLELYRYLLARLEERGFAAIRAEIEVAAAAPVFEESTPEEDLRISRLIRGEVGKATMRLRTPAEMFGTAALTGILSGANPNPVVFRGAPGSMSSRAQNFCYVDCTLGRKRFEIHVDVVYEGQSGASHEIDVSICDSVHAQDVRQTGRTPRTNRNLIAAIECKFYESTPGVALARTFVGLIKDCSPNRLNAFDANQTSAGLNSFLSTTWAPKPFTDLTPLAPESERRFVYNLEQVLRQWAGSR